jgi:hypothetical protein
LLGDAVDGRDVDVRGALVLEQQRRLAADAARGGRGIAPGLRQLGQLLC